MKVFGVFVILIFMCSGVFAAGVSPASYEVDFEPGYSGEFVFDFAVGDVSANLYVEGDLAEYVSFLKEEFSGYKKVVVVLDLPSSVDVPGLNYIKVGARGEGVDVGGYIKVDVPYPDRYVEVGLNAPDSKSGEDIVFGLELFGKGVEFIFVSPRIEIFKEGERISVLELDDVGVFPGDEIDIDVSFDVDNYSVGDYLAVGFLDYDDRSVSVENPFRIGGALVSLVNYTRSFREGKIEEFEILVKSLWGYDMAEVYAEVSILGFDSASFATTPVSLSAWSSQTLSGFLDTSKIDGYSVEAEIVLYYGDEAVSEIVMLEVIEGFDYIFWIIVLVVVLVLAFLLRKTVLFAKRFGKH